MDKVLGILRHVITAGGAVLLTFGVTSADTVTTATSSFESLFGAIGVLAGIAGSIYNSIKGKQKVAAATATASDVTNVK